MAKQRYNPPIQSKAGMIFDSIFLLALVYVALLLPLVVDFSGEEEAAVTTEEVQAPTWESLGQNQVMQEQWGKLGVEVEDAAAIINDKFDYTIEPIPLLGTALVIIGYFIFMLRTSDKEYREVIAEKFDQD